MPRKLRMNEPHYTYHVFARNNPGLHYLEHDGAKELFLDLLSNVAQAEHWNILSYCVMNNHYHICLRPIHSNLSRGMQRLHTSFAKRIHARSNTYGHVFQSRFKSHAILGDFSIQQVIKYIERNPVEAGLVDKPEQYQWSSCGALLGLKDRPGFLQAQLTLSLFDSHPGKAQQILREYLGSGNTHEEELNKQIERSEFIALDAEGKEKLEIISSSLESNDESAREQLPIETLLPFTRDIQRRNELILAAYDHGHSQKSIAQQLGLTQPAISQILKSLQTSNE